MEPKFKCPFCNREVAYESTRGCRSVSVDGEIYFRYTGETLGLAHTFCNLTCLLDYLRGWHTYGLAKGIRND